jgi:DUF4097 and DUF4098 domain-containing protein YvlB
MPMRTYAAVLAAMALLAVPGAAQDFHWTGALASGQRLEIKGVNGSIRATLASGGQAVVDARKSARHSNPDEVKIVTVPFDGGVTICAVYPTGRRARRENSCEPGDRWHSSTDDNDVNVDFTVRVPAGVIFNGETVNGDVDAQGLKGDAHVSTVNGSVDVSTSGLAEASTVNGSIRAAMGRADWSDEMRFSTVNGGITITLPSDVSTEVRAETVNGDMESDFPLTVTGKFGPRRLRGTIGRGGRELNLETVNGSIRILKAS